MLFNSHEFLFLFLPATLALYYLVPTFARVFVLLVMSLLFYAVSGLVPFYFMLVCIVWSFIWSISSHKMSVGLNTAIAVSVPLTVLFLFRYLGFTLDTVGVAEENRTPFYFFLSVAVPAGISFYTFQIMSYSIDVATGKIERSHHFINYAAYIALFPQLVAGPIVRYHEIRDQFHYVCENRKLDVDWFVALKFLAAGLFLKVYGADFLGLQQAKFTVGVDQGFFDAAYSVTAYSFRIYFDFWSYSVIAIGLGKMFGLELPRNFREPYISRSPKDFWRRWHMTLSFWIRDYFYIKIGGNKAYVRNILIVFAAVGLWHGAGWNFVAWGVGHAALVLGYAAFKTQWDWLPGVVQVALTFILVTLLWPLFYLDFGQYAELMITLASFNVADGASIYGLKHWVYLGLIAVFIFGIREDRWLYAETRLARWIVNPVSVAGMIAAAVLFLSWSDTFIYFRF